MKAPDLARVRRFARDASLEMIAVGVLAGVDGVVFTDRFSPGGVFADILIFGGTFAVTTREWLGTALMILGLAATVPLSPTQVALGVYAPLVATAYSVARSRYRSAALQLVAGVAAGLWASRRATTGREWLITIGFWAFMSCVAVLIGWVARERQQVTQMRLTRALEQQRLLITGELHDTVAHDLSLISMRAQRALLRPEDTQQDLTYIAETAAQANTYLRNLMNLLRPDEPIRPVHLTDVLDRARHDVTVAGLNLSMDIDGDLTVLPQSISDGAARVLREAVNNMVRHAARGEPCVIAISVRPGLLSMGLSNGLGAGRAGQGLGLTGMRERVEALGGRFEAGGNDDRWRVRATIPW